MRSVPAWFCAALIAAPAAGAAPVTLTCVPDDTNEDWGITVVLDPEASELRWDGESWNLVRMDDRTIVARQMQAGRPASLLINRDTGRFWQTYVGRYCNNADCSSTVLSSLVVQGRCQE